jgi:uncharacterized protein YdaU (DUF1376 family)
LGSSHGPYQIRCHPLPLWLTLGNGFPLDRLFRIDFYPQEWLTQTGDLTLEQRGVLITVCAMIYANRGPIKNDSAWIGRAANCSPRLARSIIAQLVELDSIQIQGSKITQRRCERELNIKRTHLENSAKGGRKAAENRSDCIETNNIASSGIVFSLPSPIRSPSRKDKEDRSEDIQKREGCATDAGSLVSSDAIFKASEMARARGWTGGNELGRELEAIFLGWITKTPDEPDRAFLKWVPSQLDHEIKHNGGPNG